MNADDLRVALAARALGEDLPGVDPGRLDEQMRDDPTLAADLAGLERVVGLLREASVPAEPARIDGVHARVRRTRRLHHRLIAAAALLAVAIAAGLVARSLRRETPPAAGIGESAFAEVFRSLAGAAGVDGPPPAPGVFAGPLGRNAPSAPTGVLVPFAAQADFVVFAPAGTPSTDPPVAARFRRAAPDVRDFSFAWLEYASPGGSIVILQAGDSGAADAALRALRLPPRWRSTVRRAPGTIILVAAPHLDEETLAAIAADLVPVLR